VQNYVSICIKKNCTSYIKYRANLLYAAVARAHPVKNLFYHNPAKSLSLAHLNS